MVSITSNRSVRGRGSGCVEGKDRSNEWIQRKNTKTQIESLIDAVDIWVLDSKGAKFMQRKEPDDRQLMGEKTEAIYMFWSSLNDNSKWGSMCEHGMLDSAV